MTGTSVSPGSGGNNDGTFGDGSDGTVILDGIASFPFATLAGATYTLTRDVHAKGNFTLNSGIGINPHNYRMFCQGTMTINGTIFQPANNASGTNGSTAGSPPASGSLQGGQAGATGVVGVGANGSVSNGSAGTGSGGAGGSGTSGAGGATVNPKTGITPWRLVASALVGMMIGSVVSTVSVPGGGCGGSSGAGDGTNAGGGGGSGGNNIVLFAWTIIIGASAVLQTIGGTGGTPTTTTGGCGGGGGGGGGNIIGYSLTPWTLLGTLTTTGGTAGAGVGTGVAGSNGTAGSILNVIVS